MKIRHQIAYDLMAENKRPIIKALFVVSVENIDYCEEWCYNHFHYLGYTLLQSPYNFYYTKVKNNGINGKDNEHGRVRENARN